MSNLTDCSKCGRACYGRAPAVCPDCQAAEGAPALAAEAFSADELRRLCAAVSYAVEVWGRKEDQDLLHKLEAMREAAGGGS